MAISRTLFHPTVKDVLSFGFSHLSLTKFVKLYFLGSSLDRQLNKIAVSSV